MGTKITHQEAMRIARETLETAERERQEQEQTDGTTAIGDNET